MTLTKPTLSEESKGCAVKEIPELKDDLGYKVVVPHETWFETLDALYRAGYKWKYGGTPSVPRKYLYIELEEKLLRWSYTLHHFYSCDYREVTLNELYDLIGEHPHVVQQEEESCVHIEPYDRHTDRYYAERDAIGQGQVYVNHVQAMTNEGLHDKSDIAAELAHRDIQIRELKTLLEQTRKTNFRLLQEAIKTNLQLRKLLHED